MNQTRETNRAEDKPVAIIIGAGPAGLTAALELLERTDYRPVVLEQSSQVGGISKTVVYKGNRIDLGGHRFFSKSDRVMEWWQRILPIEAGADPGARLHYQGKSRTLGATDPAEEGVEDCLMLRPRVSRILHKGRFFAYPLTLSKDSVLSLGLYATLLAGLSYLRARLLPRRPEHSLEDFVINRFGLYLYHSFFRDYTEKVWGVSCRDIPAAWGAQRLKGLSIARALAHALEKRRGTVDASHRQQDTETSLIERFLYPRRGPGQMWENVAERVQRLGGEIRLNRRVIGLEAEKGRIVAVRTEDAETGELRALRGDLFFSSMPLRALARALGLPPEHPVRQISDGLVYRDFMTVGVLADHLDLAGGICARQLADKLPDNWIYVQEPHVRVGRIQVFNNWSPYLVANPDTIWLGMEYFLWDSDDLWNSSDREILDFAVGELETLGFLGPQAVLDGVVLRQEKAYPAYFGNYPRFAELREFLDGYDNLVLLGRNGQHRYNNQDHSMLTAMVAVDGLVAGRIDHQAVWDVNTEQRYQEHEGG